MIKIKNISKVFGGVKALERCNLEIGKEKITAIIGPNGSGKSTLFNIISRLVDEDNGMIILENKDISDKRDFEVSKLGISRTFQEVRLFRNMTIKEHLEVALSQEDESVINNLFKTELKQEKKIKEILEFVGLDKPLQTLAIDLSYGQRKLLDLAVAMAKPHKVLLLDEPVSGINPKLRKDIKNVLRNLNKNRETIALIEHDMNFVMGLADYIYVLDEGKVIARGKPQQIKNNDKVINAYLGE